MEITKSMISTLGAELIRVITWKDFNNEHYYTEDFILYQDEWEPHHVTARRNNEERDLILMSTMTSDKFYGTEEEFYALWQLVANHDELMDNMEHVNS